MLNLEVPKSSDMIIVQKPNQIENAQLAITMGFFDGVHLGHLSLIKSVLAESNKQGYKSAVYTFWPHPRLVLHKDPEKLRFLTTLNEKSKIISKYGVDYMIVKEFTRDFLQIEAEPYIEQLVKAYNVKHISVGANHRFGKNGEGNADLIKQLSKKYGYTYDIVDKLRSDDIDISSTKIRKALIEGDIDRANTMLGYPYIISGMVESGKQIGRQLGFPTANVRPNDPLKLIPKEGVYAALVKIRGQVKTGMVNIGARPTIDNDNRQTIEVNIIDFDNEIYCSTIELAIVKRMRNIKHFSKIEELKQQLVADKEMTIDIFKTINLDSYQNLFLTLQPTNS